MSKTTELAILNALSAAQLELAPMYSEAHQVLESNLLLEGVPVIDTLRVESDRRNAVAEIAVEAATSELAERNTNDTLINALMSSLERPIVKQPNVLGVINGKTSYAGEFDALEASDDQELMALQATVVNVKRRAALIIGQKVLSPDPKDKKPIAEVLLWTFANYKEIDDKHPHLYRVEMGYYNLLAIQIQQRKALLRQLPPEERERLWDYDARKYVGRIGPHLVPLQDSSKGLENWLPRFKGNPENEQQILDFGKKRLFNEKGVRFMRVELGAMATGLSNIELHEYGVFDTITRLGLAFDKLPDQKKIVAERLGRAVSSGNLALAAER